jgi:hypothetical protein
LGVFLGGITKSAPFSGVSLSLSHLCRLAKSLGAQLTSEPNAYLAYLRPGRTLTTQLRHTPSLASVHPYLATLHSHLVTKLLIQSMFMKSGIGKQALEKGQRGKDRLIDDEGAARPIVQHHSAAQNQYQHQLTLARTPAESVQSTGYLVLYIFFFFLTLFALGGSRPHIPFPPVLIFVCKFSHHGSSSPVTSHLTPCITVFLFPDSADAYSRTTVSYRLTQLFRSNTRE